MLAVATLDSDSISESPEGAAESFSSFSFASLANLDLRALVLQGTFVLASDSLVAGGTVDGGEAGVYSQYD